MISNAGLDAAVTDQLRSQLQSPSYGKVDYEQLRRSPDDALSVFVDMVALSMADGRMSVTEKVATRQVGRLLGFSDQDIEARNNVCVPFSPSPKGSVDKRHIRGYHSVAAPSVVFEL